MKDIFYNSLEALLRSSSHCIIIGGDFNAKIVQRDTTDSTTIGSHILSTEHEQHTFSQDTSDNRNRFLELLHSHNLWAANTHFKKPDYKLCTWQKPGYPAEYTLRTNAQIDYILLHQRWKNACHNIESDPLSLLPTDHFPLIMNFRLKLKKNTRKPDLKPKHNIPQDIRTNT